MKKYGFTLAEVLITLALIGVVASMTLPSLNSNVQKQSYEAGAKKAYNTVLNALSMYMVDQGVDDLTETPIGTQAGLEEFARKYFKITLECSQQGYSATGASCWAEKMYSMDHSGVTNMKSVQCMMNFMTSDGMTMCLDTAAMRDAEIEEEDGTTSTSHSAFDGSNNIAFAAEFDINGLKGPNTTGRDIFGVYLDKYGNPVRQAKTCDVSSSAGRTKCLTTFQKNAWTMPIDLLQYYGWKMKY